MSRVEHSLWLRSASPVLVGLAGVLVTVLLAALLPVYWAFLGTSVVVAAISLLGLGVLTGTAGMISLCQLSFAAIGAWVVAQLNLIGAPGGGIVWMLLGGLVAALVGAVVGLPALRVRGVNLAVLTLGFAAAFDLALNRLQFPGAATFERIPRPAGFESDAQFFVLSAVVLALCGVALTWLQRSGIGAGWRMVAFSERALASVGGSVRLTKLSAFATGAALAGLSGGMVILQVGFGAPATFAPLQSLALWVLAIVVGARMIDMAVLGGVLWVGIPELLKRVSIDQNWALVLFGVLGVQAMTTRTTLGERIRWQLERRRTGGAVPALRLESAAAAAAAQADTRAGSVPAPAGDGPPVLQVEGLGVAFGHVRALTEVDLTLASREIVALIGPNGAGKTTLIDALSGFLPQHAGRIRLAGAPVDRLRPTALARAGLRRTFQQDRVPSTLTIEHYVRFVARRRMSRAEVDEVLGFFGCPPARTPLSRVDSGTRRVVEIAAQVAAGPQVLLLDEPAAGLSHDEHLALGTLLREIPVRFGASVLIIEHDLDLVRRISDRIIVLNFGAVLASGPREQVLNDPAVLKAYMGDAEMRS